MEENIAKVLAKQTPPTDVDDLLQKCKDLVSLSREEMRKYYDTWDANDLSYRGLRKQDREDKNALRKGGTEKFVMPITYAQVNTFVAFAMSVYNQRDFFYELGGTGVEDEKAAQTGQQVLEYNLDHNNFRYQKLKQFMTDVGKYGIGIFKHTWKTEKTNVWETVQQDVNAPVGMEATQVPQRQLVNKVVYQGNEVVSVSPFHWLPDPRLPLSRFSEGEFCGSEDEYSRTQMKQFERQGMAAGTEWIPDFSQDVMESRRHFNATENGAANITKVTKNAVILTELQLYLNPKTTLIDGKPLDPERDEDIIYLVWYANDSRIVRLEPLNYPHNGFTFEAAQFEEDALHFINAGLAEKLQPMQDVIDWFINSRITNVRKVIGNQLIVDPTAIELQDLRDRKSVIRLKPTMQGQGVDRFIKQLPLQDVTQSHLGDVTFLDNYAKTLTGLSENLLGQYASGRRSAQEARNVNSNAVARIMAPIHSIWNSALLPLGRKMLCNLRYGMDVEVIVRVIGQVNAAMDPQLVTAFKKVSPSEVIGEYDFLVFDGTLPSQRQAQAQAIQELLTLLISKPEAAIVFQYNPQMLMKEMLELRGLRNADRFSLTPQQAQQFIQLGIAARNTSFLSSVRPMTLPTKPIAVEKCPTTRWLKYGTTYLP